MKQGSRLYKRLEVNGMTPTPDMKYTLLDWDKKHGRVRIGSSAAWAIALIVLAWLGHGMTTVPGFFLRLIPWR